VYLGLLQAAVAVEQHLALLVLAVQAVVEQVVS
jgi:hypothetical protein